jgi:putative MATE family efflux protein
MAVKHRDMIEQNIYQIFFRYVCFNIFSTLGLSVYILADTFFIANGVGSNGLVALNLAIPAWTLMSGLSMMIGIGGSTLFAIAKGKGDDRQANEIFTHTCLIAITVGIVLMILALGFSDPIAGLLGAQGDVLPLTSIYIRTAIGLAPFFLMSNVMICFVRNDHAPNLAMAAMLLGSLTNIVFDYIYVYPLGWGMFGAALATGMSPIVGLILVSLHFIRKHNTFTIVRCQIQGSKIIHLITTGLSPFITEFSSGLVILVFNFIIMGLAGETGVAAYGIVANVGLVCISIFNGIGQGIQPIISRNFGAGRIDRTRTVLLLACVVSLIFGCLFYLLGFFFPKEIASAFISDGDQTLLTLSAQGITLYFLAFFAMGINIVLTSFFTSTAEVKSSFAVSIMRGCVLVLILVFCFSSFFGLNGVWMTVPVTEAAVLVLGVFLSRRFFRIYRISDSNR